MDDIKKSQASALKHMLLQKPLEATSQDICKERLLGFQKDHSYSPTALQPFSPSQAWKALTLEFGLLYGAPNSSHSSPPNLNCPIDPRIVNTRLVKSRAALCSRQRLSKQTTGSSNGCMLDRLSFKVQGNIRILLHP